MPDMTNTRETVTLFPSVVQTSKPVGYVDLNRALMGEVDALRRATPNGRPSSWSCDVYTTITNEFRLHQRPSFQALTRHFIDAISRYADTMRFSLAHNRVHIDMCWLNVYNRGHSQERHNHRNYLFSSVYYLKAPRGCSRLVFYAPHADVMIQPAVTRSDPLNALSYEVEPEDGLMVVFDGHLRHSVTPSVTDAERISVAVNATFAPL